MTNFLLQRFVFNRCSCGLPLVWYHSSPWNEQIEECCQVLCPLTVHRCHALDGKSTQLHSWWDSIHYSVNHAYWKLLKKPHCFLLCCMSWNQAICCCKMTYYKEFSLALIKFTLWVTYCNSFSQTEEVWINETCLKAEIKTSAWKTIRKTP